MELEVTQENLTRALQNTSRVASSRSGLPILGNILLRTINKQLLIAATNLELATTQHIGAKISSPGSITIPAKLITDFVQNLPKEKIILKSKGASLEISCGNFKSTINGQEDDEFPELPSIDEKTAVIYKITTTDFKEASQQTIIAASSDATRPVLTGVYWHTVDKELVFATTDGYRLAEKQIMKINTDISAIVPVSTISEVLRTIKDEDEHIEVLFDENQVRFRVDSSEITSRLIDGNFPDYRQLIPKKAETTLSIDTTELTRVVKVSSLFSRNSGGAITLQVSDTTKELIVSSIASEIGENSSSIKVQEVSGSGIVTLNARYILELLNVVNSKTITISFSGSMAPVVFAPNEQSPLVYTHIIMPIKN
jgi:DNA polymerase-3 subunit beta